MASPENVDRVTNAKRFPADEAIHHTGQRGPMVVLASDHDAETDRLQRHLDSRNEQIDGYERQLGIDKAGAEHTIGSEIERLTRERDVSRAAIEQLHAAVKTAQELAARRLMEVERLEAARKHWHEKWNEALTELDGYRTAEFRKNWNALNAPEPCERHRWKPGMWNVYYVRYDGQERPALSAETAEGAANALRQDAADLVRVIESEGASRDASSPCPSVHDHMWSGDGPEAYCLRCRTVRT